MAEDEAKLGPQATECRHCACSLLACPGCCKETPEHAWRMKLHLSTPPTFDLMPSKSAWHERQALMSCSSTKKDVTRPCTKSLGWTNGASPIESLAIKIRRWLLGRSHPLATSSILLDGSTGGASHAPALAVPSGSCPAPPRWAGRCQIGAVACCRVHSKLPAAMQHERSERSAGSAPILAKARAGSAAIGALCLPCHSRLITTPGVHDALCAGAACDCRTCPVLDGVIWAELVLPLAESRDWARDRPAQLT